MAAWFIPAAMAAADLIGQVFTNKSNANAQAQANATNLQIAREANSFNERMWERNNEYNTPQNWFSRMRSAGLNPSYYGMDGSASAPQAVTPPTVQAPHYAPLSIGHSVSNAYNVFMDMKMKEQQLRNLHLEEEGLGYINDQRRFDRDLLGLRWYDENLKRGYEYDDDGMTLHGQQIKKYKDDVVEVHNKEQDARKAVAEKSRLEVSILSEGEKYLKEMPKKEYERLVKELKSLDLDNDKKEWDKQLRDKGLDPSLDWLQQLFYMAMHDKNAYNECLDALIDAVGSSVSHIAKKIIP